MHVIVSEEAEGQRKGKGEEKKKRKEGRKFTSGWVFP